MVCAGYQKKGIVFLNTNPHCASQFIPAKRCAMGMGVTSALRLPPLAAICASVILCRVMNTGAKIVFIATDTARATQSLSMEKPSAAKLSAALVMPMYSMNIGVPLEKIIIAMFIPMPSTPHTTMRGITPKVGVKYLPVEILHPSISPMVERMANFRKLITMPCAALNSL